MRERQKCALEKKSFICALHTGSVKTWGVVLPLFSCSALLYLELSPAVCGLVASLNGKVQFLFLWIVRNSLFLH